MTTDLALVATNTWSHERYLQKFNNMHQRMETLILEARYEGKICKASAMEDH
jgi:hypothetical protein